MSKKTVAALCAMSLGASLVVTSLDARAFGLDYHYSATEKALYSETKGVVSITKSVRGQLIDASRNQDWDIVFKKTDDRHFNDCSFSRSAKYIRGEYDKLVKELVKEPNWAGVGGPGYRGAAQDWGYILHTLQDFYAHSNWVDVGRTDLVDSGYGAFAPLTRAETKFRPSAATRRPAVLVEVADGAGGQVLGVDVNANGGMSGEIGTPQADAALPAGWKSWVRKDRLVTVVITEGTTDRTYDGIITGVNDVADVYDNCPKQIALGHWQKNASGVDVGLHKDDPGRANHQAAYNLAVKQTAHEFCRLISLVRAADPSKGKSAVGRLLEAWTGGTKMPAGCK